MYYICHQDKEFYGIKDTSDGVIEYYNTSQIRELVDSGLKIYGVYRPNKSTLRISVYSQWNGFDFLSKKDIMKLRLAGILDYQENKNKLLNFQFLNAQKGYNYAICLSELGITELGWSPFRSNKGKLNVIIDKSLKKFDTYNFRVQGSVQFWIDDNTSYKLYKSSKDNNLVHYSPNLSDFIKKSEIKLRDSELESRFNSLFNNFIKDNSTLYYQLSFQSEAEFYNYFNGVNADFISKLDIVKMLFEKDIEFSRNSSILDSKSVNQILNITELVSVLTYCLVNNKTVPDDYLDKFIGVEESSKYFSFYCNYGAFFVKYAVFLRNYVWLKQNNFNTSFFGVIPSLLAKKFYVFINSRGFDFFLNHSVKDINILFELNPEFKNKFLNDYYIDTSLISEKLSSRQIKVYKDCLNSPPMNDYKLQPDWLEVYKRMSLAYVRGELPTLDTSVFDGILTLGYRSNVMISKLRKFFITLVQEYGVPYKNLDFYKFALDCLLGKGIYCKKIGLPRCIMTQDIRYEDKKTYDGSIYKDCKIRIKFYTQDKEGSYWLYRCYKEKYLDDTGKTVNEWEFEKIWSPSLSK